jgi:hypothetical protein
MKVYYMLTTLLSESCKVSSNSGKVILFLKLTLRKVELPT